MRIATSIRVLLLVMFLGSISVAGTAVVWSSGERIITQLATNVGIIQPAVHRQVQDEALEKSLRSYRVRLSADGTLPGRINVVDPDTGEPAQAQDMTIAFVQHGHVVAEVHPGIDGSFQAEGVGPGIYSLVGHGPEGYIAYGLEVLPAELTVDRRNAIEMSLVAFQEIQQEIQIDSLAIPPVDGPAVLQLAREHLPPEVINGGSAAVSRLDQTFDVGPQIQHVSQVAEEKPFTDDVPLEDVIPAGPNSPSASLQQNKIRLSHDGTLTGRMRSLNSHSGQLARFRRLNIFLVRDNRIVAQAPVNPLGVFTIPNLGVGRYSFAAAGTEGFAAFSIHTVTEEFADANTVNQLIVPVSFQQPADGHDHEHTHDAAAQPECTCIGQCPAKDKDHSLFEHHPDCQCPLHQAADMESNLVGEEDVPYAFGQLESAYGGNGGGAAAGGGFGGAPGGGGGGFGGGGGGGFGGGGGGFGGGGGGGLGFGGGLGTLLGLGGLGLAAAALADDDNGSPQVVSPAVP
ncbi:MAG: hypothetical protein KDA93_06105 [Planctomycetaceae bacterium]|nr:hypothetical protein [Planctomycetaceae bacterium]